MKKLLPFLLFISLQYISWAQYIPFPESGAKWSLDIITPRSFPTPSYPDVITGYIHETAGDTLINDTLYQKITQTKTWTHKIYYHSDGDVSYHTKENCSNCLPILKVLLRQDTLEEKVYVRKINNESLPYYEGTILDYMDIGDETTLFDFSSTIGDTIYFPSSSSFNIISNIDTVIYNDNIPRKRIHFDGYLEPNAGPFGVHSLVEGIGCNGLFGIVPTWNSNGRTRFNCFSINNEYIKGEGFYGCDSVDVISSITNIEKEETITIFPNPVSEKLTIGYNNLPNKENITITIHDHLGRLIGLYDEFFSTSQNEIDVHHLTAGMYYLSIKNQTQIIFTDKFIKQ